MWKDSIRNIVVIFQPNILRIVGFYVRHSAIHLGGNGVSRKIAFEIYCPSENHSTFTNIHWVIKKVLKLEFLKHFALLNHTQFLTNMYVVRASQIIKKIYLDTLRKKNLFLVAPCHGLRTANEGINQRYLKKWADVADKICLGPT